MKHILIINGNPDPTAGRLSHALARAYREGAEESGAMVRHINVGALDFPMLRDAAQFTTNPSEAAIVAAQDAFLAADHIVFIFPLWLGGPPAIFKAYMEQVGRNYFLLGRTERGFPPGRLKGRSARVIVTMGMPPVIYRFGFGAHGVKAFNRSILNLAGIKPVRTTLFGGGQIEPRGTARTIEKIRQLGRKMA